MSDTRLLLCLFVLATIAAPLWGADPAGNRDIKARRGEATQTGVLEKSRPLQGAPDEGFDRRSFDTISDDLKLATKIFNAPKSFSFIDFKKRDPTQITRRGDLIFMGAMLVPTGVREFNLLLQYPLKISAGLDADTFPLQGDGNLNRRRGGGKAGGTYVPVEPEAMWAAKVSAFSVELKNEAEIFNQNVQRSDLDTVLPINTFAKSHPGGRVFLTIKGPAFATVSITGDEEFFKGFRATYENPKYHRLLPDKIAGFPMRTIDEKIPSNGILKIGIIPRRQPADPARQIQDPRVGFGQKTGIVRFTVQVPQQKIVKSLGVFEIGGRFERKQIVAAISPFLAKDIKAAQEERLRELWGRV